LTEALEALLKAIRSDFVHDLASNVPDVAVSLPGEDIPVGSPIANRNRSEIEGLIVFSSIVLLRTDLSGNPTFRELLKCVEVGGAYAHQDLPSEKLQEQADLAATHCSR